MEILRISGKGGTQIYDAAVWTKEESIEDYTDQTGEIPDPLIHTQVFDAMTGRELISFIRNGCE